MLPQLLHCHFVSFNWHTHTPCRTIDLIQTLRQCHWCHIRCTWDTCNNNASFVYWALHRWREKLKWGQWFCASTADSKQAWRIDWPLTEARLENAAQAQPTQTYHFNSLWLLLSLFVTKIPTTAAECGELQQHLRGLSKCSFGVVVMRCLVDEFAFCAFICAITP